jgi:protease II
MRIVSTEQEGFQNLFQVDQRKGGFAYVSPDDSRMAYDESLFGMQGYGVVISNLDGSQESWLALSDTQGSYAVPIAWSPDGKWLALVVHDPNFKAELDKTILIIQSESCQALYASALPGRVIGWSSGRP